MSYKDIFFSLVIGSLIIGGSGVLIWYNIYVSPELEQRDNLNTSLKASLEEVQSRALTNPLSPEEFNVSLNYYPDTIFSSSQRNQLFEKYFLPMQAYYNEDSNRLNAILVEEDSITALLENETIKYSFSFDEDDLWLPQCINQCQFTNTFFARYPEIVQNYAN